MQVGGGVCVCEDNKPMGLLNADLVALADAEVKADHHMSTLVRFNRACVASGISYTEAMMQWLKKQ
jgi:hypothetical protein